MYRTLAFGNQGADVLQLQRDLSDLGFFGDLASGTYDMATAEGVAELFHAHGYTAPTSQVPTAGGKGAHEPPHAAELPQGDAIFASELPAVVGEDREVVGRPVPSPALSLTSGPVYVRATLTIAEKGVVSIGQAAVFRISSGRWRRGRVSAVNGTSATIIPLHALTPNLVNRAVSVRIVFEASGGAVLAVPEVALQTAGNGSEYVLEVVGTRERRVTVLPGIAIGGEVAINGDVSGLIAGARVVVGQ